MIATNSNKLLVILNIIILWLQISDAAYSIAPPGMIALFEGNCPSGWSTVNRMQGQLLLSTPNANEDGLNSDSIGVSRLKNQQQPSHNHGWERRMCTLSKFGNKKRRTGSWFENYKTINGGVIHCDATGKGSIGSSSVSTHPFAQLRLCKNNNQVTVPVGTVAYFDNTVSGCPSGWQGYTPAQGRFLYPKNPSQKQKGLITRGTAFRTNAVENRKHRHGLQSSVSIPTFKYGTGSRDTYALGRGSESFSGVTDARNIGIPFHHVLTCKAVTGTRTILEKNPPNGALLFFDDTSSGGCPSRWSDGASTWRNNLIVAVPNNESPRKWGSSSNNANSFSDQHKHRVSAFFNPDRISYSSTCCVNQNGGDTLYGSGDSVSNERRMDFDSSISFRESWTRCNLNTNCNTGGGTVLVRFGKFQSGNGFSKTNHGANRFNYKVVTGNSFRCDTATFGDPLRNGGSGAYCEFANTVDNQLPSVGMRFCKSSGWFETRAPTLSPSVSPTSSAPTTSPTSSAPTTSPTFAPSKSPSRSPTLPTPLPTRAPSTQTPTAAPTVPQNLCTKEDLTIWENNGRSQFDDDLTACGINCAYDVATESETVIFCVTNCLSDTSPNRISSLSSAKSRQCNFCIGRYAECMLKRCDCVAARETSERCVTCSRDTCESNLLNCTGFDSIPEFSTGVEELDSGLVMILAIGAGGGVLFFIGLSAAVVYVRRRRSNETLASSLSAIDLKSNREAAKSKSLEASNPVFGVGPAVAPVVLSDPLGEDQVTVRHTFDPEYPDELGASEGEVLDIVKKVDDSWYLCRNQDGVEGIIPSENLSL